MALVLENGLKAFWIYLIIIIIIIKVFEIE